MGKYIQATATRTFLCAWKCCACSHINVEEPPATATVRENITLFQKEAVAREKARQKANENLEKFLDNIPTFVNRKFNFNSLEKCGTCSQCGATQPWVGKPPVTRYLMLVVIVLGLAGIFLAKSISPFIIFGALVAALGIVIVGELVSTHLRGRAAQKLTDEYCRPLAITKGIPDDVSRDDPRLAAILAHVASKKQSA